MSFVMPFAADRATTINSLTLGDLRAYQINTGVRACVRACVHACVRACVRACVCVCVILKKNTFIADLKREQHSCDYTQSSRDGR